MQLQADSPRCWHGVFVRFANVLLRPAREGFPDGEQAGEPVGMQRRSPTACVFVRFVRLHPKRAGRAGREGALLRLTMDRWGKGG